MKRELGEELQEGMTNLDPKTITQYNTQILEKLFYIYFKLIIRQPPSKFFIKALDGCLKYVHLISVNLIWDLEEKLAHCASNLRLYYKKRYVPEALSYRLFCVLAMEEILSGPGVTLNLDDKQIV